MGPGRVKTPNLVFSPGFGGTGMKRFVERQDRSQLILLPDCLDDYVGEDNPARIVDAFVDELDLAVLGFAGVVPEATGRPSYHPVTLLKIYLYGYLNRVQSSRRLEREARRNIELMWLTGRLAPDFKTIADFRKDNGAAIRAACCQFVVLCRELGLFTRAVVAIDGSKFKAVNNRDKNYTVAKVIGRIEQVDASIALPESAGPGRPRRERYRRGQVGPVEGEDCRPAPADARLEGNGADGSGRTRPASLADRSRRPFNGDQRQRHRHCRLQCADRRRRRAPSDRGPRSDQSGVRPPPACAHGVQGTAGHRLRADHRPGRPRLLQRRPGPLVRRHGRRTYRAQDPDVKRGQARLVHPAGLHLRRRARPLHLPSGRKTDQNSSPRGSHGRLRPLPPPERLLYLSAPTPMHADPAADHQALGA